jgi:hypothetical protein
MKQLHIVLFIFMSLFFVPAQASGRKIPKTDEEKRAVLQEQQKYEQEQEENEKRRIEAYARRQKAQEDQERIDEERAAKELRVTRRA